MAIEDKEIVRIDATVIAGALIFLGIFSVGFGGSFAGFAGFVESSDPYLISIFGLNPFGVTLSTIFIVPFALSAILATFGRNRSAKIGMVVGFAVLVISLSILSVFTFIP